MLAALLVFKQSPYRDWLLILILPLLVFGREIYSYIKRREWPVLTSHPALLLFPVIPGGYVLVSTLLFQGFTFRTPHLLALMTAFLVSAKVTTAYWARGTTKQVANSVDLLKVAAVFFSLFPVLIISSQEIQFAISKQLLIHPLSILSIFTAAALLLLFWERRRVCAVSTEKIIIYISLPCLVFCASAYTSYQVTSTLSLGGDWFHVSEALLGPYQLANFGKVPWMDLYPTHGFSDHLPGYILGLFDAGRGLDVFAWAYLQKAVLLTAAYFFLAFVASPLTAAVGILGLSIFGDWAQWPSAFLLFALFAERFHNGQGLIKKSIFALLLIGSYFYYPAIGAPVLATTLVLTIGYSVLHRECVVKRGLAALIASALTTVLVLALHGGSSRPLGEVLIQWTSFISMQAQSMSQPTILGEPFVMTVYGNFLVPLSYFLLFWLVFFLTGMNPAWKNKRGYLLSFLLFYFLLEFNRRLGRYSLFEGFDHKTVLFVFTVVALGFIHQSLRRRRAELASISILLILTFTKISQPLLPSEYEFSLKYWGPDDSPRVTLEKSDAESKVIQFFTQNLKDGETFYDFSNTPAIYLGAKTPFPTFLIPSMYHTGETAQTMLLNDLNRQYEKNKLKFVLFSRPEEPAEWHRIDGVPQEVRAYRATEFIYQNFQYCQNIEGYQIWCRKDDSTFPALPMLSQKYDLKMLPMIWGNYGNITKNKKLWSGPPDTTSDHFVIPITSDTPNAYVAIEAPCAEQPTTITISMSESDQTSFEMDVCSHSSQPRNYAVRLGTHSCWWLQRGPQIELNTSRPIFIRNFGLLTVD